MRCRDAKLRLAAQRDGDLAQSDVVSLQEHLKHCLACLTYEQSQQHLDILLRTPAHRTYPNISTERIILAVERQKRITQQLVDLRMQQQSRLTTLQTVGPRVAAVVVFVLGSLTLALLAVSIVQPDLIVKVLPLLSGVVEVFIALVEYLQMPLSLVAYNSWLLSGVAFVLVILMGMWLRLMRHPQEA
jgi:hypothetical protein